MELQDGEQKSVRIENLCPADALRLESPASGSVAALAAAPAADVAASTEESPRRGDTLSSKDFAELKADMYVVWESTLVNVEPDLWARMICIL